ncbi:hypothetical protein ACJIZ3_006934 [Penstemon smallii]|uniref:Uncharacterized protein n=1 Tax=Penstemon smallii TaxID=265156 RepID=A0ABD3S939_9LAMI
MMQIHKFVMSIKWILKPFRRNTMVQTLEAIRGGGGSIKVGTTGTISALMSKELDSTISSSKAHSFPTSVSSGNTTPRKSRLSVEEASNSSSSNVKSQKGPETVKKTKNYTGRSHQIPMLTADNISIEGTPIRQNPVKRAPGVVEIVDIKCLNQDNTWLNPITNRLRKLGFSKLSDNFG